MIKNKYIKLGIFLIIGFSILASCKKKFVNEYTPYNPTPASESNVDLKYNSPLEDYPVPGNIVSDTPTFKVDGAYIFGIDTVYAVPPDAKYNYSNFTIGAYSGVITYDNSKSTISPGSYFVSVSVVNVTGLAIVDSALEVKILDVPIEVTAVPDLVNVGALDTGTISELRYVVIGSPSKPITDVTYEMITAVPGFSVTPDGFVKKTTDAESGEHKLSFVANTNLGSKEFKNILTVNVGAAPSLEYVQQDGSTPLTKVTLSPWTAYKTAPPKLEGMTPDEWKPIYPDEAPQELKDAVSFDADGSMSIAADMNIPEGDYLMGVKVTSSGVDFKFKELFTISVVARWDDTPVLSETFDYATESGTPLEPPFASYTVNDGVPAKTFNAHYLLKTDPDPPRDIHAARLFYGKDGSYDVTMVLSLTNDGTWRNLRIKFGELYGYGTAALDLWERTLWYSYVNEPENGTFTPDNWTQIMAPDDPDWLTDLLWKDPDPLNDGDLPSTGYQKFSGLDPAQTNIYVCWRYVGQESTKGAQWFIDDVYVQAAKAYEAEEE